MKLDANSYKFLGYVVNDCVSNGVNIKFELKNTIYWNTAVGYFWENHPNYEIAIAAKNEDWFSTLVHEYSHLQQYLDSSHIWEMGKEALTIMSQNKGKEKLNPSWVYEAIALLESDCDKRAVEFIKKFGLKIPLVRYKKHANINAAIYLFWEKNRKAKFKKGMWKDKSILKYASGKEIYPEASMEKLLTEMKKWKI